MHERFSWEFVGCAANGIKIICECSLGNDIPEVRKRKAVAASDFVPAFRDIFKSCSINPGKGSCHDGEVHVIHDGIGIAGLAFAAADVLFDLFETGLNFPPCAIVLDDLCSGQIEVSREKSDPLSFTKDPNHPDRAFEGLEHDNLAIGHELAVMSIEKHTVA